MMRPTIACWLLMTVVLAGCKAQPENPTADNGRAGLSAVPQETQVESRCAVESFEAFLPRFMDDTAFQKSAVADPLSMSHIDATAEPEPAQVAKMVALGQMPWPVMPASAAARQQGLELAAKEVGASSMAVVLQKPDTGYRIICRFSKSPCGTLHSVDDKSI